ncbi:MAG: hypothetical protein JWM33_988 [Caulobacteraceae bacterium]|nr:hypothetical protein [Caulobacteraceae bacterium]
MNAVLMVQAMGESRVTGSYGAIDGRRTARVCTGVERQWTVVSQLDKTKSPTYAAGIDQMTSSLLPLVAQCRKEFGTPPGGVKLPG